MFERKEMWTCLGVICTIDGVDEGKVVWLKKERACDGREVVG